MYQSQHHYMYLAGYAYKGLLQLMAIFVAFHTERRVKIKALNDFKEIASYHPLHQQHHSGTAGIVVEFALNTYHKVYAALFGLHGTVLFLLYQRCILILII